MKKISSLKSNKIINTNIYDELKKKETGLASSTSVSGQMRYGERVKQTNTHTHNYFICITFNLPGVYIFVYIYIYIYQKSKIIYAYIIISNICIIKVTILLN